MGKQPNNRQLLPIVIIATLSIASAASFAEMTGAAFLKINPSARSAGMSSAFTALADDASAVYWNPSGTAGIPKPQLMFTHTQWFEGMNYEFASFVHPYSLGAIGLSVSYLAQGNFEGRDENRMPTSDFSASDLAISLSSSRRTQWGSIGANLKIINQNIESERAAGIAVDLGCRLQRIGSPLSLGFALQNLGPQMKFINEGYSLPLTLNAGIGYRIAGALALALDLKKGIYSGNTNVSIGTEYWIMNTVALRTGYLSRLMTLSKTTDADSDVDSQTESLAGLGAGLGLKLFGYQLDYALVPYGELGNTHRISLLAGF